MLSFLSKQHHRALNDRFFFDFLKNLIAPTLSKALASGGGVLCIICKYSYPLLTYYPAKQCWNILLIQNIKKIEGNKKHKMALESGSPRSQIDSEICDLHPFLTVFTVGAEHTSIRVHPV